MLFRSRAAGRVGRTVVLRIRFGDMSAVTRSHSLPQCTSHTHTVLETARSLLAAALPLIEDNGITRLGLSIANLDDGQALQLILPFDQQSGNELDAALDAVRERFGSRSVTRAVLLHRGEGLQMPMLPD